MMWLLWGSGKLSLSKITAAREVDSNKIISLSFTMSSVGYFRLGLDQRLQGTRQDSCIQKSEKYYFFLFNIGQ